MKYKKPIPVSIDNIVIGEKYYTCSWSGPIRVIAVDVLKDKNAIVVKINSKKKDIKPFVRPINYIFDNPEMAKTAGKNWEHDERKRRRKMKTAKWNGSSV